MICRAEIIYHARNQSITFPQRIRPFFIVINILVYFVLIAFWVLLFFLPKDILMLDVACNLYYCLIYLGAAIGFVLYGGRLYLMLKQFPIESSGRQNKLREVNI
jgi:hypothetical protein